MRSRGTSGRFRTTGRAAAAAVGAVALGVGSMAVTAPPARAATSTNLLSGDQSSFDQGTGGWAGSNAALSEVHSPAQAGTGSLMVTAQAAGGTGAVSGNGPQTWTAAVPGQVYTASAWVVAGSTPRSAEMAVSFLSSNGSVLATVWGQTAPDTTTGWSQVPAAVGIAPAATAYAKVGVLFYSAAAGESHYVDTVSLTTNPSGSAAVTGPLHTSGNGIHDANNQPVTLRGTVSDWLDWNSSVPVGSPLDDSNVAHMKLWGDNVVRVLLSEDYWNPNDCHYSSTYVGAVDQVVQSVTSRGMLAMLDLHNNERGVGCEASGERRMADSPGSVDFWRSVADRYKSNPLVAFDLYNEPHDITWSQWLNGGVLTDSDGVTWQAAGMQQLYDTVRGTGAQNLVFVSGNWWGNDPPPAGDTVNGTDVVYAAHAYTCPQAPPPQCTDPNPTAVPSFLTAWASFIAAYPVVVTEFGWPDPGGSAYNQNVINWAESVGVGWTAYAWSRGGAYGTTTPHFGLLADSTNFEPEASGMPVLAGLVRNS